MTLKQIYKKALKNNYKGSFQDFIKDFSNCREAFVETQIAFSFKIERSLANYLKRYYS
jgi:hypothetical protein|tara:strand:+ start:435 stop:608 length:174 start_codon:yes stop_codon:yes gene_type:complete